MENLQKHKDNNNEKYYNIREIDRRSKKYKSLTPVEKAIGRSWGLNESNVYRIIIKIEKILMDSKLFRLPGKKNLLKPDAEW